LFGTFSGLRSRMVQKQCNNSFGTARKIASWVMRAVLNQCGA